MLQKQSVSDLVVEDIQRDILNKNILPGDKLPTERELAEKYSLSRIPVREALKTLSQMGLVETKHGKGTFVREPDTSPIVDNLLQPLLTSGQALIDLALLRKIIETQAAKDAALSRTDEDMLEVEQLEEACRHEIEKVCRGEANGFQKADYAFHMAIAKASKSNLYKTFLETIEKSLRLHQSYAMESTADAMPHTLYWHGELVKAIARKDTDSAAKAMEQHLHRVVERVRKRMSEV